MDQFKEGGLHCDKSDIIVNNLKQTIAIALSEAEVLNKKTKNLMFMEKEQIIFFMYKRR